MNLDRYRTIVVEGPIGVGKTSLVQRLADVLHARKLLERPQENPFLEKFYRDPSRFALSTQMSFLFQRMAQLREQEQADPLNAKVISDFLLDKDALFARLTLDPDELKLYEQLYEQLRPRAPAPDLVIYLRAEPATLMERIRERGVTMEAGISDTYLERLCESYSRFFYHYDAAPLLIVNTEHFNPVGRDEHFTQLLARIDAMRGKREYLNLGE
ncbi:deoxynucleoside kinase [Noviherbaspirillum aerium]|uniref:deoxynucleoside kinase n=1 Tax=Noviherbaspirillum aerium TaxID=2588497 RepID=UPI00124E4057|nr:deoxynucleoside kinase [Noviherbaspirillum aerium]